MKKQAKILVLIWGILLGLAILSLAGYLLLVNLYDDQVYPGVSLGGERLSGLNHDQARDLLAQKSLELWNQNWVFKYQDQSTTIDPRVGAAGSIDLASPILDYNLDASLGQAWSVGRSGGFFSEFGSALGSFVFSRHLDWQYTLDEEQLKQLLKEKFGAQEMPLKNANFEVEVLTNGDLNFKNNAEGAGREIDYDAALRTWRKNLDQGVIVELTLDTIITQPKIKLVNCPDPKITAMELLVKESLELNYQNPASSTPLIFKAEKKDLAAWLNYLEKDNQIVVGFDSEKIKNWLTKIVAPKIDQEPIAARFEVKNGRVSNFQNGTPGRKLDLEKSAAEIIKMLSEKNNQSVDLIISVVADNSAEQIDNFGISEIIGTGHSNFAGSPKNRRHNIAIGAAAVNGLLIKPGEEFSLVKALGDVDKESGYLPELVIKENRTIPEYGGGLCQIGTTLFRAAIGSGLPVTSRRSHSYRVTYYEPAGTDAAVYIPQPDVRFLNDSDNYILIQVRIEKDDLYFDFWGIKDGRKIDIGKPVVYNIIRPAPTKIISSPDLAPGIKKCTEKAHNGADAYFDYQVIYHPGTDQEEIKKVRFSSHYVPWQEVCLVGAVASTTLPIATSTSATSTNP